MINLNLLNKALTDANIKDSEFRLLYLIANNISMSKADEKEIYNGFLMDKLNLGERQIQRLTKSLADKGYITKRAIGSKRNKNGNIYSLVVDVIASDTSSDTESVKKDTLYNDIKEKKKLLVNSCTTEGNSNTNLRKCEVIDDIPFDMDEAKTETISEVKETESDKPIYVNSTDNENMSYTDEELRAVNQQAVEEWQMIEETRHQHISNQHKEVNEWVGKKLSRGYDLLGTFRQTKKQDAANAYAEEINKLIGSMNKAIQAGVITPKQGEAFGKFIDATNKAYEDKQKYFNRGEQMKKSKSQTVIENDCTSILNIDEEIGKAAPRPTALTENDIKRMADEVNLLFWSLDVEESSELDKKNKINIEANGTPQQLSLYKQLTA